MKSAVGESARSIRIIFRIKNERRGLKTIPLRRSGEIECLINKRIIASEYFLSAEILNGESGTLEIMLLLCKQTSILVSLGNLIRKTLNVSPKQEKVVVIFCDETGFSNRIRTLRLSSPEKTPWEQFILTMKASLQMSQQVEVQMQ